MILSVDDEIGVDISAFSIGLNNKRVFVDVQTHKLKIFFNRILWGDCVHDSVDSKIKN